MMMENEGAFDWGLVEGEVRKRGFVEVEGGYVVRAEEDGFAVWKRDEGGRVARLRPPRARLAVAGFDVADDAIGPDETRSLLPDEQFEYTRERGRNKLRAHNRFREALRGIEQEAANGVRVAAEDAWRSAVANADRKREELWEKSFEAEKESEMAALRRTWGREG